MFHVLLSALQREELRARTHRSGLRPEVRDRLEMLRLSDAGWSVPHIAQHLGLHEQTVRRYVKAFLAGGFDGLAPRPHPGRPPRVHTADLEALERRIDESDRTWTTPQLAQWLADERRVQVCPAHLSRLLHRRAFRWKRTKQSVKHKQGDPKLQRTALEELAALKKSGV
jgi:transposase